ncbi:homoserine dehydrogenase [Pseudalkalibacillus sp. Hm43]|uniref:homoserine dehydrogenase n=1 Tax=Pseudalkalibacillus sp. Hm43 TaxID=3450742 RepID=UPI003F43925C
MAKLKIALLGFGTVGSGVYEIIQKQQDRLRTIFGKEVEVAGVLIQDETKSREVDEDVLVTSNFEEILHIPDLDIVVEAIVGVEPGYTYLKRVIEKGCHVVTANKELFAHKGHELKKLAAVHGVEVSFEAAVAGGIPVIGTLKQLLQANQVVKIDAILNGTSNYILTEIREKGRSFSDALAAAQEAGYAEADPSNDVDGHDAFFKTVILTELLYGVRVNWDEVNHKGIRHVSVKDLQVAEALGFRLKHIASLELREGKLTLGVEPKLVAEDHPLYSVEGVDNALVITGDFVGQLKLQGPGAGKFPTASAVVEDLVNVGRGVQEPVLPGKVELNICAVEQEQSYLLIGNCKTTVPGKVEIDHTLQIHGQLHAVKVVTVRPTVVEQIVEKSPGLVAYPISGTFPSGVRKASVTA